MLDGSSVLGRGFVVARFSVRLRSARLLGLSKSCVTGLISIIGPKRIIRLLYEIIFYMCV